MDVDIIASNKGALQMTKVNKYQKGSLVMEAIQFKGAKSWPQIKEWAFKPICQGGRVFPAR